MKEKNLLNYTSVYYVKVEGISKQKRNWYAKIR